MINGIINIYKIKGFTSHDVVAKLRGIVKQKKIGHTGTLDPDATGVLPVCLGSATKLCDMLTDKEKEYIAEFTFGVDSDTLDSTGNLIQGGHVPNESEISAVLPQFFGDIMQVPPKYSAKNVNGRRGYDLARAGIDFELQPKKIHIYGMECLGKVEGKDDTFRVKIRCGGGTYIRSIGRDVAEVLGTKAVMSALRRTQSGIFTLQNAIPFSVLEQDPPLEELQKYLIPTEDVLAYEKLELTEKQEIKLYNGQRVAVDCLDGLYKIYQNGVFYGIGEVENGLAKAKTKLC